MDTAALCSTLTKTKDTALLYTDKPPSPKQSAVPHDRDKNPISEALEHSPQRGAQASIGLPLACTYRSPSPSAALDTGLKVKDISPQLKNDVAVVFQDTRTGSITQETHTQAYLGSRGEPIFKPTSLTSDTEAHLRTCDESTFKPTSLTSDTQAYLGTRDESIFKPTSPTSDTEAYLGTHDCDESTFKPTSLISDTEAYLRTHDCDESTFKPASPISDMQEYLDSP